MQVLRRRWPTRNEAGLLFAACAVPIYTWALLMYFHQLPNYLLRMSLPAALAVLPYVLAVALLDSLLVLAFLVFACLALPDSFFKAHCVAQGTYAFLVTFIWIIPVHFQEGIMAYLGNNLQIYTRWVVVWLVTYLLALFVGSWMLHRHARFEAALVAFSERLTILSPLYLFTSLLSFAIILLRNLF